MTRFLLFSHDTYGLGHFRRSALLAAGLAGSHVDNEVLIVTGSPRAQSFELPDRVDTVKLPTATKSDAGCYQPRKLGGTIDDLIDLRSAVICAAVTQYEPDVMVVDHAPAGMGGELLPLLEQVARAPRRPRMVLGLRDIIDDARTVESAWDRDRVWEALDHFDDILVYGDSRVMTTAQELAVDERFVGRVIHTGYVAPVMPEPLPDEPFLLVTAGGGGDGQLLLRRFLDAVEAGATAGVRSIVVTGPLLSAGRCAELRTRAARVRSVELIGFSDRMRSLIASAVGVISMAGYNTVVEELAANVPALLVPRRSPRLEQHIRATRLAPFTQLEHCPSEALTTHRIGSFIQRCHAPRRPQTSLDLSGVDTVVNAVCAPRPLARTINV